MHNLFKNSIIIAMLTITSFAYADVGLITTDESIMPVLSKISEEFSTHYNTGISIKYIHESEVLKYVKNGGLAFFVISGKKSTCGTLVEHGLINLSYNTVIFQDSISSFSVTKPKANMPRKMFTFPMAESIDYKPYGIDEFVEIKKSDDAFDIIMQNLSDGSIGIARKSYILKYKNFKIINENIEPIPYFICEVVSSESNEIASFEKFLTTDTAKTIIKNNYYSTT